MDENIYSPPTSDLTAEQESDNILASRSSRLWASLIDLLTIIPIGIPLMYFTGGFDGIETGAQPSTSYTLIMALISTAAFLAIHGKILIRDGQTWGKKFQKIKIVTTKGEHATIPTLAKRLGFYWLSPYIPGIGSVINIVNLLFIFSKSKRCLHDYVGGTKVVMTRK